MNWPPFLMNVWVWLAVALISLYLCSILPTKIKDDRMRKLAYRIILVPISLILICYTYPVGIELCRRLATGHL